VKGAKSAVRSIACRKWLRLGKGGSLHCILIVLCRAREWSLRMVMLQTARKSEIYCGP